MTMLTVATATHVGGRPANADAATVVTTSLGTAAAVVDGIGSELRTCAAAQLAAGTAATVAAHRGAQAGLMAAADTMPDYPGGPNAVAAVASVVNGQIEIAHVGDAAVWTYSATAGLRRWTVDQTAGEHIRHMLDNPGLTDADREALERVGAATEVLADYVLNGLKFATVSTMSWTPLRGEDADVELIIVTSDGVHKPLATGQIEELVRVFHDDPQRLADVLVEVAVLYEAGKHNPASDNATAAVIALPRRQAA
ncbi:Serine/threonine protein phosphatase PrpC [Amycolatopsis tolypomycina]|uniref:Serine/threonine protein phosphatase PrpC n=1 Tax=Amycolatopsis tolypomycina TaxID=208445 RepID=A0A1H4JTK7_9PSEU|nr:hypothetical protein [Amycolatopsis tolypomycina]SEB48675.1 Serine/threonine protein phosphatase PrpC [Amycolatopsis tolypomycina]SEB49215.1 Serine/threonine protein phosphatase PrpC [Amycolatopsis tolypomycina]